MEPALHLVLPTLIALVAGVRTDIALALAPLSLLFDLDIFLGPHRRLHSLVVLMAVSVPTAILIAAVLPQAKPLYLIGLFYVSSHLLLDVFIGEMALFYPLSPKGYGLRLQIGIENTPVRIRSIRLEVKTVPEIKESPEVYTLLSGQGAVSLLLFLAVALNTLE